MEFKSSDIKKTKAQTKVHFNLDPKEKNKKPRKPVDQKKLNKALIIIVIVLSILTISGITTLIVQTVSRNKEAETPALDEEKTIVEKHSEIAEPEMKRMIAENPDNISAALDYYSNYINNTITANEDGFYSPYILIMHGYKYFMNELNNPQAVIDFFDRVNFNGFDEAERHQFYLIAIDAATKANNNDAKAKYEQLAAQTKEAYDKQYEVIRQAQLEAEAEGIDTEGDSSKGAED